MAAGMGRGSRSAMLVLLGTVAVLLLSCRGTKADTFPVGGSMNWAVPADPTFYQTWAASYTFKVGDVLQFNYDSTSHNVQAMNSDTCDLSQTKGPYHSDGSTAIQLNSTGVKVYICTVSSHCSEGMKLAITVNAAIPASGPDSSVVGSPTPVPKSAAAPRLIGMIGYGTVAALVISAASFFL